MMKINQLSTGLINRGKNLIGFNQSGFKFIEELVTTHGSYTDAFFELCDSEMIDSNDINSDIKQKCVKLFESLGGKSNGVAQLFFCDFDTCRENNESSALRLAFNKLEEAVTPLPCPFDKNIEKALVDLIREITRLRDAIRDRVAAVPRTMKEDEVEYDDEFSMQLMQVDEEVNSEQQRLMSTVDTHVSRFMDVMALVDDTLNALQRLFREEMQGHRASVNESLLQQLGDIVILLEKFEEPKTVISIAGETSTGKTTLMCGIVGAKCLPVDTDANTAFPVQIIVTPGQEEHILVIPPELVIRLNNLYCSIVSAIHEVRSRDIPLHINVGPLSLASNKGASELFRSIADKELNDYTIPVEQYFDTNPVVGHEEICNTIAMINNLLRLAYSLKSYKRFSMFGRSLMRNNFLIQLTHDFSGNILNILPTLYARCRCTENLPYFGKLSLIDTPGTTEFSGDGTLMEGMIAIVNEIYKISNRALVLTTPTTRSSDAAGKLVTRVKKAVGQKMMVIINKFDSSVRTQSNMSMGDVLQSFRQEYQEVYGIPALNVQWLQAIILYNVELGRFSVVDRLPGSTQLTASNFVTLEAENLAEKVFGGQWKRNIRRMGPAFTVEYFCESVQAESVKSNFGNVIGMCLLPTFIRSLAEFPAKFVKSQVSFFQGILRSLKTRKAVVESSGARAQVVQILQATVEHTKLVLASKDELKKKIEDATRKAFVNTVKTHFIPLLCATKKRVHDIEVACKQSGQVSTQEGYSWKGKRYRIIGKSTVKFNTEEDVTRKQEECYAAVNEALAESPIEGDVEIHRKIEFMKGIKETCVDLSTKLQDAWSQFVKVMNVDDEVDMDVVLVWEQHREALNKLKASLNDQVEALGEHIELDTYPSLAPKIRGGVSSERSWLFWTLYRFAFTAFYNFIDTMLRDHYDVDKFCENQIKRGNSNLDKALDVFMKNVSGLQGEVYGLIEMIEKDIIDHNLNKLLALIDTVQNTMIMYREADANITKSIAEIGKSEAVSSTE